MVEVVITGAEVALELEVMEVLDATDVLDGIELDVLDGIELDELDEAGAAVDVAAEVVDVLVAGVEEVVEDAVKA